MKVGRLAFFMVLIALLVPIFCSAQINEELRKAVIAGDALRVNELISKGADVNAKSDDDQTALSIAEAAQAPALSPDDAIFQLQPPPNEVELKAYRKLKLESPAEVPSFIATRKYIRVLNALRSLSADGKFDFQKMPPPRVPHNVNIDYAMTLTEQLMILEVMAVLGQEP